MKEKNRILSKLKLDIQPQNEFGRDGQKLNILRTNNKNWKFIEIKKHNVNQTINSQEIEVKDSEFVKNGDLMFFSLWAGDVNHPHIIPTKGIYFVSTNSTQEKNNVNNQKNFWDTKFSIESPILDSSSARCPLCFYHKKECYRNKVPVYLSNFKPTIILNKKNGEIKSEIYINLLYACSKTRWFYFSQPRFTIYNNKEYKNCIVCNAEIKTRNTKHLYCTNCNTSMYYSNSFLNLSDTEVAYLNLEVYWILKLLDTIFFQTMFKSKIFNRPIVKENGELKNGFIYCKSLTQHSEFFFDFFSKSRRSCA